MHVPLRGGFDSKLIRDIIVKCSFNLGREIFFSKVVCTSGLVEKYMRSSTYKPRKKRGPPDTRTPVKIHGV